MNKIYRVTHLDAVQGNSETRNAAYFMVRQVSIAVADTVMRQERATAHLPEADGRGSR